MLSQSGAGRCIARLSALLVALNAIPAQAQQADMRSAVSVALPVTRSAYNFLHANPELGKQEMRAHDYLMAELRRLGFTIFISSPSAPTAVIAIFDSGRPGRTIALRAEMDARPLTKGDSEPSGHNPRSNVAGVMHNCGHDVHASILLGVAALVQANPGRFSGKIVFVFQPAEETPGGADDIVRDGVLTKLGVERIFAEHVAPGMPVGTVAMSPGAILAGSNYFTLTLTGRGSHAAAPYDGDDVALGAMRVAEDLSYAPARSLDIGTRPVVVSVTSFTADSGASNVLPNTAVLKGTIRAFEDLQNPEPGAASIESVLLRRIQTTSAAYGLSPQWELRPASPPTRNDPALFEQVSRLLPGAFSGHIDTRPSRGMFSEDFAYYTPHFSALYVSLGIAKDGLGTGGVHTTDFTIHPDSLAVGLELMARLAEIGTSGAAAWQ